MKSIRVLCSLLFATVTTIQAQVVQSKAPETSSVALSTPERPETPTVSLALKVGEALRTFTVTVQNGEGNPLKVYGAQATGSLYVVDYPREIAAKGEATVTLLYLARQNSTATADLLRLITSGGEKTVQFNHDREAAVQFDATSLQWRQDEAAVAKAVTVTIPNQVTVPKGVSVMDAGSTAAIEALGGGRYRIFITPGSTAKPRRFPVMIQFAPALPGANTVIVCSVAARG